MPNPVDQLSGQIDTHQLPPRPVTFSALSQERPSSTVINAPKRFNSKLGGGFVISINADDRHRQPMFMRPGGAVRLWAKF
ncbi:hypothetical protein DIJ64_05420 [Mycobacterium leprae]|uniref:Uncharacterized protein n=1 Tax=Mycobacterium leprae TaxID=1769 RepID=A0AAD0KRJ8_MYCLR|nr:hypothetical protein DIJ64_05420 [Mycobacterium leprae]